MLILIPSIFYKFNTIHLFKSTTFVLTQCGGSLSKLIPQKGFYKQAILHVAYNLYVDKSFDKILDIVFFFFFLVFYHFHSYSKV